MENDPNNPINVVHMKDIIDRKLINETKKSKISYLRKKILNDAYWIDFIIVKYDNQIEFNLV